MNEKQTTKLSKFLSLVLRHQPETIGIQLDENGWTEVATLLEKMNKYGKKIHLKQLHEVVATNNKKRFAFNGDQTLIRANQGHSVKVDLGYSPQQPPETLFHGTGHRSVDSIFRTGLEKRDRHHVHLSVDEQTARKVGQRHGKPVILEVLSGQMYKDGFEFFVSDNGVWLTEKIPAIYLRKSEKE
ncbi:RNA 2'-phosphotransferase [Rapidithrix thailandica]|uniref:Probable RNA 2'-phosphotransferase n=1 Tax=Rapidithrix thailandica TaxID=413964 RepID=A0AAW9S9E7_9BACT